MAKDIEVQLQAAGVHQPVFAHPCIPVQLAQDHCVVFHRRRTHHLQYHVWATHDLERCYPVLQADTTSVERPLTDEHSVGLRGQVRSDVDEAHPIGEEVTEGLCLDQPAEGQGY